MISRLLFNKYTFLALIAVAGDRYANKTYEEATFTEVEQTQMNTPNYTPTEEAQQTIEEKKALQNNFTYKVIVWYEGVKARGLEAVAEKLKPLREKLATIRQDSTKP